MSDFPRVHDGEVITLPQDRPYKMACCGSEAGGCDLVHDLWASINDDGEIELRVKRNESETQRLRQQSDHRPLVVDAQPTRPTSRAQRAADLAGDNIARDGEVVRVPLTMQDSALAADLRTRFPPVTDDAPLSRRERRLARSAASGTSADAARLATEAKLATEAVMARDGFVEDYSAHRPGYRFSDRSASEAARTERMTADSKAWDAYSADPYTGTPTRAVASVPLGAYPLSAGEGNLCSIEGRAGHLVKEGGYLVCRADASDAMTGDAQPGTREFVDQEWRRMVEDTCNAWKS